MTNMLITVTVVKFSDETTCICSECGLAVGEDGGVIFLGAVVTVPAAAAADVGAEAPAGLATKKRYCRAEWKKR